MRRPLVCLLVGASLLAVDAAPVAAQWSASATGSSNARATNLAPPTALSAAVGCVAIILIPRVTLTWTASPSTFAAGYDILRSTVSGGPYSQVGTASGGATTTFADTASLGLNITYFYVIRARRTNWVSATTSQVSAKTPLVCL